MRTGRWEMATMIVSAAFAAGVFVGCGSDDDGGGGQVGIEDVLPDFKTAGNPPIEAVLMPGQPPAAAGGPTIMAPVAATVPDASTQGLTVTSNEEFDSLTLTVPGTDGYWALDFGDVGPGGGASPVGTSIELLVTFADDPPFPTFDCLFNASNNGGPAGPDEITTITIETGATPTP